MGEVEHDGYYAGYYGRGVYATNDNHRIVDLIESSLEMLQLVDSKGAMVAKNLLFPEGGIAKSGVFQHDPDDEDFEGFTGNKGALTTHFYRKTASFYANHNDSSTICWASLTFPLLSVAS
ncbi:hypothetical protein BBP40_000801 [Aspergillus hancockii]|nr:hypothetical protein BBP40_000801 [Aspergillus hancockii]